ncbi:hypothetical protein GCM10010211_33490 [Streptomyces albospinus]|uniref:Uncharacterized protein n=1 Tax=Streptomyces albospinus TaxID=285515 RepID=A0ABQ2V2R8_9ACTN|nr:hypothetical protein GCM10010211_33490 [Streptomyces albospinus]
MTVDGIRSREVAHACPAGGGQLKNGPGEVGDVNRAPDLIGEQHAISSPGGQVVDECLMRGAAVADDQRGAGDDGGRGEQADRRFGRRLRGPVWGDRIRHGGFVVVHVGAGEDGVTGHMHQPAAVLNGGHRQADRAVGRGCPIGLAIRRIDDDVRLGLPERRFDLLAAT